MIVALRDELEMIRFQQETKVQEVIFTVNDEMGQLRFMADALHDAFSMGHEYGTSSRKDQQNGRALPENSWATASRFSSKQYGT